MHRLNRLSSTHNNIRSNPIDGHYLFFPPTVGQGFTFVADALDPVIRELDGARYIRTSEVTEVQESGDYIYFATQNSEYELEADAPGYGEKQ